MNEKPGVKTSEFWITLVSMIMALVAYFTGQEMNIEQISTIWGPAAAYVFSRGFAKWGRGSKLERTDA